MMLAEYQENVSLVDYLTRYILFSGIRDMTSAFSYHLKYDELPMFSFLRLGLHLDEPHQLLSVNCGQGIPDLFAPLTIVRFRNFSPRPQDLLHSDQTFHSETTQSRDSYSGTKLLLIFKTSSGRFVEIATNS